jgi:flavin reductase (DIM6/NTAB) family NADH-FMN oxidoreductase RutF
LQTGIYGATILAEPQRELSERFAGRIPEWDEDRFARVETETLVSGVPFIKGGLAYFDCRVHTVQPVGENTLFIAEVVAAKSFPAENPLVYFDRGYRVMTSEGSE